MRLDHRLLFFLFITTLAGCLPDSFTKWDKEEPNVIVSPSTVSINIDGEDIRVEESSNGTAPEAVRVSISSGSLASQTISSENDASDNVVRVSQENKNSLLHHLLSKNLVLRIVISFLSV